MVSDEMFFKLGAQVLGLELAIKTLAALHFASQVKNEAGFAKAAEQAANVSKQLQGQLAELATGGPTTEAGAEASRIMREEMAATVARCFDQTAASMGQVAQALLAVSQAPYADQKLADRPSEAGAT